MERMEFGKQGRVVPLGDKVEVTPDRQVAAESVFDRRVALAMEHKTHLWIVTIVHYASDQMLDAFSGVSGELPLLDHESIAMRPGIICWICEESFEPRIRNYKCRGEK